MRDFALIGMSQRCWAVPTFNELEWCCCGVGRNFRRLLRLALANHSMGCESHFELAATRPPSCEFRVEPIAWPARQWPSIESLWLARLGGRAPSCGSPVERSSGGPSRFRNLLPKVSSSPPSNRRPQQTKRLQRTALTSRLRSLARSGRARGWPGAPVEQQVGTGQCLGPGSVRARWW